MSDDIADDDAAEESAAVDAADPASVKRAVRKKQRADQAEAGFWRGVLSDPVGRRAMWQILDAAHAFDERFACGPNGFPQPEATWLHAGEQKLGMRLYLTWLKLAPEGVRLMHVEHDPNFAKPQRRRRDPTRESIAFV